jgi:hypothetical protein
VANGVRGGGDGEVSATRLAVAHQLPAHCLSLPLATCHCLPLATRCSALSISPALSCRPAECSSVTIILTSVSVKLQQVKWSGNEHVQVYGQARQAF